MIKHWLKFACFLILLAGCNEEIPIEKLKAIWESSDIIEHETEEYAWKTEIKINNNIYKLTAKAKPFANVTLADQNTGTLYTVYKYADYLYPIEIRLSEDKRFLIVKVSGKSPSFSSNWEKTYFYSFDILNKKNMKPIELSN